MKKILFLILIIVSACSNDFLEIYPKTTLNEGNFYQSEEEYITLANGCYTPMRDYEKNWHWVIAEMRSDNSSYHHSTQAGEQTRMAIDQFIASSSDFTFDSYWKYSYAGITRCNKLLYELDRTTITWSESYKERCYGEALFLRALYYFNLVRQFGGVPLVLKPITSVEAVDIKRSTKDIIYENIINDLQNAVSNFSNATDIEEDGRANWSAAASLLGKVYLTLHDYTNAESILDEVINLNKYILLPDYADLFDPSNKDFNETIFAIQYSEGSGELSQQFIFQFAPPNSKGEVTNRPNISLGSGPKWNKPTQDLLDAFEQGDYRKDVSIGYWTGEDWDGEIKDIPYCKKYKPPITAPNNWCGDNFPIIRYADVLLMYAEVLNEQGKTIEAIPYIEQVRQRAGLSEPLSGYDKISLRELIAKERQVEFCFENHRWYDLLRTGKAIEILSSHGIREKEKKPYLDPGAFEMDEYKLLAPIPVEQVLLNEIEQNPGY
jgi:starch-binding outer membrane protein, SusD/RagB family